MVRILSNLILIFNPLEPFSTCEFFTLLMPTNLVFFLKCGWKYVDYSKQVVYFSLLRPESVPTLQKLTALLCVFLTYKLITWYSV